MSKDTDERWRDIMNSFESPNSFDEMKVRYEQVVSQLCLIGRLNEAIDVVDELQKLCLAIVSTIIEFVPAENCSIMLYDPKTGNLNLYVAKGREDSGSILDNGRLPTTVLRMGEGAAGWAAENVEILHINDCQADSRFVELESAEKKISSVICAPIVCDGTVIGIINCSHPKKQHFRETDRDKVALIAEHAAVLLNKAFVIDQFKKAQREYGKEANRKNESLLEAEKRINELQDRLCCSERFASLGELMPGIVHELSNRLSPILIYSQMLQQSPDNEQGARWLHIIEESAIGAKTILETVLGYSRSSSDEPQSVNLNQTIRNSLTLMEHQTRKRIELSIHLSPELPPVKVNEKKIAQVFLNVIGNALSAMGIDGGKLTIRSSYDHEGVIVTISDTGPGVPEEVTEKIFEPFFTTKEPGKGTGLGLSTSKRYIEEHGGRIYVENSSSAGATFVIRLPRAGSNGSAGTQNADRPTTLRNMAKILVVDDDSTIRDVIRDVLGEGYNVEFAADGQDATNKIESDPFDLLVVDYHMPSFDGKQLYEWIKEHHPSLKRRIVFSTGDIYSDDIRTFIEGTGCNCLIKPFSTKSLREVVSDTLKV